MEISVYERENLLIRDILVRIRILGLTDTAPDLLLSSDLQDAKKNKFFSLYFLLITF
jgi:hypothetical protein